MERCSFSIDRVEALDAPLDARFDIVFAELFDKGVFNTVQELLSLDAAGLDGGGNLFEADGIGIAKGQVFELAAHFAHAETVGEGGIDVERFAGNGFAALGPEVLEGAHVVQAIGELDEDDAHIGDHGQQHFAYVFGLPVFAIGELDFVDLGDAFDDVGDLVAKSGFNLFVGGGRVFDSVVQQAGGDGRRIHLHLRENFGNFERMDNVRLAGGAHLALMMLDTEFPGFADEANVLAGAIGLHLAEQGFKAIVDRKGIWGGQRTRIGLRARGAGVGNIGRKLLPGCRHASL